MGNVCRNNAVQPMPSSRVALKSLNTDWALSVSDRTTKSEMKARDFRRAELIPERTTVRTDSDKIDDEHEQRRFVLARTYFLSSRKRKGPDAAVAAALGHNMAQLVKSVNSMHLLTPEEKRFVLEDVEKAQLLTCSNDDAESRYHGNDMADLLKEMLNSYHETSLIQSSKNQDFHRLNQLLASLQDDDLINHPDQKTVLLEEMKKQFLVLLNASSDEDDNDDVDDGVSYYDRPALSAFPKAIYAMDLM